jgi:hypothetical protein
MIFARMFTEWPKLFSTRLLLNVLSGQLHCEAAFAGTVITDDPGGLPISYTFPPQPPFPMILPPPTTGVNVMITNIFDFQRKNGFFSKTVLFMPDILSRKYQLVLQFYSRIFKKS